MASEFFTQVTLFPTSNLNADASVNTWAVSVENAGTDLPAWHAALTTFYQDLRSQLLSPLIRSLNNRIQSYSRDDPEPRRPVWESTFDLSSAPGGLPLPPEVALCLSFQAVAASGLNQASRRGRVFIGPLAAVVNGAGGRPTTGAVDKLVSAGQDLLDASELAAWEWRVWSSKLGTAAAVDNGWVDDEFDTQRRRGRPSTTRTIFTVT